jgi:hypothetical protein
MLLGGKATKRSKFGQDIGRQITKTLETTKLVSQSGLRVHVIDAEWRANDVSPSELENLLGLYPNVKTFVTLAARRRDVDQLLSLYVSVIEEFGNAGLCVVAGNKSYLDEEEASQNAYKSVKRVLEQLRGRVARVLLGVEGMEKGLNELLSSYPDVTPFFLYDEEKLDMIGKYSAQGFEGAVYVPYAIDKPQADVVRMLADYALRRKWLRKMLLDMGLEVPQTFAGARASPKLMEAIEEAVSRLSICGTRDEVVKNIRKLKDYGVTIVVGLPVFEEPEQVLAFGECIKRA